MIAELASQALLFIESQGAWGVFVLSIIEEVFLPIPSSLTFMAAGFLFIEQGNLLQVLKQVLISVSLPGALGLTLGSFFFYYLGRIGGRVLVARWGGFFGITTLKLEEFEKKFQEKKADDLMVLLLRTVPLFPNVLISAGCGLLHYPLKAFIITGLVGNILRGLIMGAIGFYAKEAYINVARQISNTEHIVLAIVLLLFLVYLSIRYIKYSRVRA